MRGTGVEGSEVAVSSLERITPTELKNGSWKAGRLESVENNEEKPVQTNVPYLVTVSVVMRAGRCEGGKAETGGENKQSTQGRQILRLPTTFRAKPDGKQNLVFVEHAIDRLSEAAGTNSMRVSKKKVKERRCEI